MNPRRSALVRFMSAPGAWSSLLRTGVVGACLASAVPGVGNCFAQNATQVEPLATDLVERVERALSSAPTLSDWDALLTQAVIAAGGSESLSEHLKKIADDESSPAPRRFSALCGLAQVKHRGGELEESLRCVDAALTIEVRDELLLLRARLLDALDRIDDAIAAWRTFQDATKDPALRETADLRVALLDAFRPENAPGKPIRSSSQLYRLASADVATDDLRNRAAVVLGLLARPNEAIEVYRPTGEGSERFKQEIRAAEWALSADLPRDAQRFAWNASRVATLKRDRLFALTVLGESHRRDGSLAKLIDRFAAEPSLDAESRRMWIDLLRETSRIDEALALFRSGESQGFTPEMRRELLEMCREAGRDDELVKTYREQIAAEPSSVEWRQGLCRHYLERGQRETALAVWDGFAEAGNDPSHRLILANAARDLGLDDLALQHSQLASENAATAFEARMFRFDFELRRGNVDAAIVELDAADRVLPVDSAERVRVAEAFERVGDKKRACVLLENVREHRPSEKVEEDLEMRLAWLLSETGDDEKALARWRALWGRVESVSRRRQIEDRLMAAASRLGVLADIAVELEEKLLDGKAEDRDAALLVRLYQKVGDPVSAAEVIEEHMKRAGKDPVALLDEKARIYLGGKDYYHFERTVRELIERDPDNRGDRLRQLAMSQLERGRPQEARQVLTRLAQEESGSDAAEFEAGVLSLANLHADAVRAYQRGLARHPERIDGYLLLANALKATGRTRQAIGMFCYLVENADKDDLFTIAIDGLLNMEAERSTIRFALRATMERIARRHDRMYLYQLCADLYEESNDSAGRMRALEAALPIAGEQRASLLRELMDIARGPSSGGFTIVNGMVVERREGGDTARRLAYGRRLIGLGDVVPPQVYLELGESFLAGGEVSNAAKTFAMARDVPDFAAFQRQIGQTFEQNQFVESALTVYERAMSSQGIDIGLITKCAALHEQLGHDDRALELSRRGIEVLLSRNALFVAATQQKKESSDVPFFERERNVGEFDQHFPNLLAGFLALANANAAREFFAAQLALLEADLEAVASSSDGADPTRRLANCPRIERRGDFLRRVGFAYRLLDEIQSLDTTLLRAFPADADLLSRLSVGRKDYGYDRLALELIDASGSPEDVRRAARDRIGYGSTEGTRPSLTDAISRILPLLIEDRKEDASRLLRSVSVAEATKDDLERIQVLFSAAVYLRDSSALVSLGRAYVRLAAQVEPIFDQIDKIEALLARAKSLLDADAHGLIVQALVDVAIVDDKQFAQFAYLLSTLQRSLAKPLFTFEDIKGRVEKCAADSPWMLSSFVLMVEESQQFNLVQTVWDKIPPTDRSSIAIGLLLQRKTPADRAFIDFVASAIAQAVDLPEAAQMLQYDLRELVQSHIQDIAEIDRLVSIVVKRFPENALYASFEARIAAKRGDRERAVKAIGRAVRGIPGFEQDYEAQTVSSQLVEGCVPEFAPEIIAEIEREIGAGARRSRMLGMLGMIQEKLGKQSEYAAFLEKQIAEDEDDLDLLASYYRAAQRDLGFRRRFELLDRLAEETEDENQKTAWRNARLALAKSVRDPERAFELRRSELEEERAKSGEEGKRLPEASVDAVKKALDESRQRDAEVLWRRTWRSYPSAGGIGSRVVFIGSYYGSARTWPGEGEESAKRSRGGISAWLDAHVEKKREARKSYDVIAEQAFGPTALESQVRSLESSDLRSSRDLIHGAMVAEQRTHGDEVAKGAWLERIRNGRGGMLDRAKLLAWFEDHTNSLSDADRDVLGELTPVVNPVESSPLRALARIYSRLGDTKRALTLFRWCATLASNRSWFYGDSNAVSSTDLLAEIKDCLSGDDRVRAVEAVLDGAGGAGELYERNESYRSRLETWLDTVGPALARQRCAMELTEIMEAKSGLMREAAIPAAAVFARSGDLESAIRCAERAVCGFGSGEIQFDARDMYSAEYLLRAPDVSAPELKRWSSRAASDFAPGWAAALAAAVLRWDAAGRLNANTRDALAIVVIDEFTRGGAVAQGTQWFAEFVKTRPSSDRLVEIDLRRMLGEESRACEIEDGLLLTERLHPERIPEVVRRIEASGDSERALEVGTRAALYAPHPELLDQLIALARRLGRDAAVAEFERRKADCATAAKDLKEEW